jgi:hypothetical protein
MAGTKTISNIRVSEPASSTTQSSNSVRMTIDRA